jgi:regulatory protein
VALRTTPKKPLALKATAVRLLARREYARAELAGRLIARGASRDDVDRVLDELERAGYLSDARFAQAVIAQKAGRYGKRAIAHEFREKRVAPAVAEEALATLAHVDEFAEAMALWRRRFGAAPKDEREKARHVRFLMSRGYGMTIALKVLRRAGRGDDAD